RAAAHVFHDAGDVLLGQAAGAAHLPAHAGVRESDEDAGREPGTLQRLSRRGPHLGADARHRRRPGEDFLPVLRGRGRHLRRLHGESQNTVGAGGARDHRARPGRLCLNPPSLTPYPVAPMRTALIILGGLVLLAVFVLAARLAGGEAADKATVIAAQVFIPVWLALAGVNMWVG